MIRHQPILCAIALAALCFLLSPGMVRAQPITCNFAAKAQFLPPGVAYDPRSRTPPPQGAPIGQPYADDLNRAFAVAPVAFQARLCALDGVFVDQTPCATVPECIGRAWGLRVRNPAAGGGRYIAIPAALWAGRPDYSEFANHILHALIPLNSAGYSNANPGADTFAMTVLAALAHEYGHVRWYDVIDPGRVGAHSITAFCGSQFFSGWATVSQQPNWRELQTFNHRQTHRGPDRHRTGGHVADVDAALGNPLVAGDMLDRLYQPSAPWPDFFAAISPDEDFVETYKFKVLTTAATPLTSLPITIPGTRGIYREDLAADYLNGRKPELARKVGCIAL
jgi:hypothetical protein